MAIIRSNLIKSKNRDRKPNEYSRINSDKTVHLPTFSELGTGRHSNMWLFSTKSYAISSKPNEYSRMNSDKPVHLPKSELETGRHSNMPTKSYAVSISSKSSSSSSSSCSTYDEKPTTPDSKRPKSRGRKPNDDSKSPKAPPTFRQLGMGRHSHMWLFDATGWKRIFSCHQSSHCDQ